MIKQDVLGGLQANQAEDLPKEQRHHRVDSVQRNTGRMHTSTAGSRRSGGRPLQLQGLSELQIKRAALPPSRSCCWEFYKSWKLKSTCASETPLPNRQKQAVAKEIHAEQADGHVEDATPSFRKERIEKVTQRIRDLPEGEELFARKLTCLRKSA